MRLLNTPKKKQKTKEKKKREHQTRFQTRHLNIIQYKTRLHFTLNELRFHTELEIPGLEISKRDFVRRFVRHF